MIVKGRREPRWQTARFDIEPGPRDMTWDQAWHYLHRYHGGAVELILRQALDEGQVDTDERR